MPDTFWCVSRVVLCFSSSFCGHGWPHFVAAANLIQVLALNISSQRVVQRGER